MSLLGASMRVNRAIYGEALRRELAGHLPLVARGRVGFERGFLKVAGAWFEARWCLMGNDVTEAEEAILERGAVDFKTLGYQMLGCVDAAADLRRQCRTAFKCRNAGELLGRRSIVRPARGIAPPPAILAPTPAKNSLPASRRRAIPRLEGTGADRSSQKAEA